MFNAYKKPWPYQKINWAHPISKGLVGCWVMNEGGGNKVYDLSENGWVGTLASNLFWAGDGVDFSGSGDPDSIATTYLGVLGSGDRTILICFKLSTEVASTDYVFLEYGENNPGEKVTLRVAEDASDALRLEHGGGYITGTKTNLDDGAKHTIGFALKGTTLNDCTLYVDGLSDAVTASGNPAVAFDTVPSELVQLGYGATRGADFDGIIYHCYFYDRALTPSEITQLYINPYAMFEPMFDPALFGYVSPVGGLSIPIAMHHYTKNIGAR